MSLLLSTYLHFVCLYVHKSLQMLASWYSFNTQFELVFKAKRTV